MWKVSNYYQQSKELPAQNDFQLMTLWWTDVSTHLREATKCATVIGLVVSASSLVFNFDPTAPLTLTAICGTSWLFSSVCVNQLEPNAKELIGIFQRMKEQGSDYHVHQ